MGDQMTGVFSDNLEQMRLLTNHLIKLGHRNIVFVHGEYSDVTNLRVAGFKKALAENGIEFKDSMLEESKYLDKDSVWNVTSNVLHRLNVPTAIMFPDDISAIQGLGAIREAGLSCPRDVSITGFDGIQLSQVVSPHLTTIKQDSETIGKVLAQKLIQGMQAYDMWYKLIATNPANSMASSYSATLASAQANFVNGKSAMIPYAQWAKFELSAIADNGTLPFNIAMMKTPKATASAADCNYMPWAGNKYYYQSACQNNDGYTAAKVGDLVYNTAKSNWPTWLRNASLSD